MQEPGCIPQGPKIEDLLGLNEKSCIRKVMM